MQDDDLDLSELSNQPIYMRFVFAVFAVWVAIVLSPEPPAHQEREEYTIYAPHHCETGWWTVSSDSDSVTVACSQPDDSQ